ncbi:MAG: ice-binding family protein [Patescibacteria group bacterium]|jgi:hypothetical protein
MSVKTFFVKQCVPMVLFFAFMLMAAPSANAATTPSLGMATTYGVLANTYTNTTVTTINGDVGFTTGPAVAPLGVHTNYGSGSPYATAGIDQGSALTALAAQPCTFTFAPGAIDLSTDTTHGAIGVYTPGVYCSAGAMDVGGPLTLSGSGTYIFRPDGALTSTAGAVVSLAGASVCDVFWTPTAATTLAANTTFVGTVIDDSGITVGANTNWSGRALAFNGTVTTDTDTISAPSCSTTTTPPPSTSSPSTPPLINVRKVPSPLALPNGPGPVTYSYTVTNPGLVPMTSVTLTDDKCSNVIRLSGDTDNNSQLDISETWMYTCSTNLSQTTVNYATARGIANDMASVDTAIAEVVVGIPVVPPLIHIVKTPLPLTLPFNGGSVTYSYAVTNPGTVALTDVTVIDNKCSSVTRASGDINNNSVLETTETWAYACTMNVPMTTVNTAIATGHANGLTAIDTALATVVVAGMPVPPLIHIIKKPDPVILPSTGGVVTYTYTVSNPGTVLLNNVSVTDDKCGPVTLISGDVNGNGMMGPTETWTYTCRQNLTVSTTNTATAQGSANGLTATDISVASVVLASALIAPVPLLPSAGYAPNNLMMLLAGISAAGTLLFVFTQRKRLF